MPNELTTLPVSSISDIAVIGEQMAKSGIMGIKNPADGFIVAATCHQEGISLMQFTETFHLIGGKPSKKAEAMLASLLELGGEYEIEERSPERVAVVFRYKKAVFKSELTWEEAKIEDYTKASNGRLKDNWSTPRRRMQMMWARVVSDGVRVVCPMATKGCYTPEEVMDFPEMKNVTPSASAPLPPPQEVDYSICRYGKYAGRKWAEIPQDMLKVALTCNSPHILAGDREVIREVLEAMDEVKEIETEEQEQDNGNEEN